MHIMTLFPASRIKTFLRCNLAALIVGLMVVATSVSVQTPQRANAAPMTGFTQVTVGTYFTCALKSDQTVWCWGYGGFGQLGNGATANARTPVQVTGLSGVTQIST